ncbi:MAG: transposase [Candidatus Marinimicrobia bacterium]|nr:transposase [Candidatus Neomarinimicrobiota bacterium]
MLQEELTHHLGYERYQKREHQGSNLRNGSSTKSLKGKYGSIAISEGSLLRQVHLNREGEFEPLLIAKHQSEFGDLEGKILSLYAKGMSVSVGSLFGTGYPGTFTRSLWTGVIHCLH